MNLQSLFHGKLVIDNILLQQPKISFLTKTSQDLAPLSKFQLEELKNNLEELFIFLLEDQESLELTFKNAVSPYFKHMDGSFFLSRGKKEILFNASIKELKLKANDFSQNYFGQFYNLDSIVFDQLTLTTRINSDFEIQGDMKGQGIIIRSETKELIFDSKNINASFTLSDNIYQLDIKPFKIDYPNAEVSAQFLSDRALKKSEIQLTGKNIHIDQAKKVSLTAFINNKFVNNLFDILHSGISPEINVSFQAEDLNSLFSPNNLNLKGKIENGEVKIPKTDLITSHIEGSAEIHKGILDISTTQALIKSSIIKQGQLSLDLLGFSHVPFNGKFLLDVDLSMVPETIGSLLPNTLLAKELSKVHHVTGRSNVRLNLSIPTNSNNLEVKIDSDDFSVNGSYDRIPDSISVERINFKYDSGIVNLTHTKGTLIGIKINDLNTTLDFKEEPIIDIQSGSGQISLDSTMPFLMSHKKIEDLLSPFKKGNGKIDVTSIQLSGPVLIPEKWTYEITGNSDKINLGTRLNQKEIENLSCQYHISDNDFSLENIFATFEHLSWLEHFMGEKHINNLKTPLIMENGKYQTKRNRILFFADLQFPEGQKLQITTDGDKLNDLAIKKIIILDPGFSNAVIALNPESEEKTYTFNGILNTKTLNRLLIPESYLYKKINNFTEGESVLIHTDNDSTINIFTKKINLTSIFSSQKSFSTKNPFFSDNIVKFKTENLSIKNWTIKDVDSVIAFRNNDAYIKLNNAALCDLEIKGFLNFEKDRISAGIPFKAHNRDNIQNLVTCLFRKDDFMDGRYTLTGEILSDSLKHNFLNTLKGSILFKAEEGRVYKLTLLSRILSILNVSSLFKGSIPDITQKGFAYKHISIEAEIKDSIIDITNAIVNGNDMTIVFNGQIDLINDYIDLTCLVAPFKTIDLIIEKIPIVNTLLGGNLVSVPVKATGKISDPIVVPLHPSAVGEGLINMMKNILKTPVKLLDKITDDKKQPEEPTP
ncbi:MAG: AsmA-like C-terminal domain-containing protein [Desulfobacula sp.]